VYKDNHNDEIGPMTVSSCWLPCRICIYCFTCMYDFDLGLWKVKLTV